MLHRLSSIKPIWFYIFSAFLLISSIAAHISWPSFGLVPRTGALLVVLGITVAARDIFRKKGTPQGEYDVHEHDTLIRQGESLAGPGSSQPSYNDAIDAEEAERRRDDAALSVHGPILAVIGTMVWGWVDLLIKLLLTLVEFIKSLS